MAGQASLQQAGQHEAPYSPGAKGSARPEQTALAATRGPTPTRRSEEKPNPARCSRAPSVARPAACTARPCRNEPTAPRPPRYPEHRRLPWPSFHKAFCELLLPLPGGLFLAAAENAVRGRGSAGAAPASCASGNCAHSPARASFTRAPRGPAPGPQRPASCSRVQSPRRYRWRAGHRALLSRAGLRPLPWRGWRGSCLQQAEPGAFPAYGLLISPPQSLPPTSLGGFKGSRSFWFIPRASSPSAPILELRTCARDCATAKNSPGRGGV